MGRANGRGGRTFGVIDDRQIPNTRCTRLAMDTGFVVVMMAALAEEPRSGEPASRGKGRKRPAVCIEDSPPAPPPSRCCSPLAPSTPPPVKRILKCPDRPRRDYKDDEWVQGRAERLLGKARRLQSDEASGDEGAVERIAAPHHSALVRGAALLALSEELGDALREALTDEADSSW
jgi:hypothetical protein